MRPIDADALIEKCGGWYVDECTESGFIGTLENLLATEPTIQPQSTTGQLDNGARSTAQSTDLIDRQQAIAAVRASYDEILDFKSTGRTVADSVEDILSELPAAKSEYYWRQFKTRPLTEEEKEFYPDIDLILDCDLPKNGQKIFITVNEPGHEPVQTDVFCDDGECSLDSLYEIGTEATAWMPSPEPYKGGVK